MSDQLCDLHSAEMLDCCNAQIQLFAGEVKKVDKKAFWCLTSWISLRSFRPRPEN